MSTDIIKKCVYWLIFISFFLVSIPLFSQSSDMLLSAEKPVTSSTSEADIYGPENAVDGDLLVSRWASDWNDNEWIFIDLGEAYNVTSVKLTWEFAYAVEYKIQISDDAVSWNDVIHVTDGDGNEDVLENLNSSGRYVRMFGIKRFTGYGFSLYEFEVYGTETVESNMALSKSTEVSSVQTGSDFTGSNAVDGDMGTRWSSDFSDPEWISVDLGSVKKISKVVLHWETASAANYDIEVSENGTDWETVYSVLDSDGGIDELNFTAAGRYVRMYGHERNTPWGYSIFEFEVYGGGNGGDTVAPTKPGNLTARPEVHIITLNWTPSWDEYGVSAYKIYVGSILKFTTDGNATFQTISGFDPDTEYEIYVVAEDAAGNRSEQAHVTARTKKKDNPDEPVVAYGNIALKKEAYTSSVKEGTNNDGSNGVDGNLTSRWESEFSDPQWIEIDLGLYYKIRRVILSWETASAKSYTIEVSKDREVWDTLYSFNPGGDTLPLEVRTDDLKMDGAGRYIRMSGIARNDHLWSYSLFEFKVYCTETIEPIDPSPPAELIDPVPPGPQVFDVIEPNNGVMITDTRRPTLRWNGFPGAERYEVWLNVTKTDYDWYKWGSLLDRFSKVGEVTGTVFTLDQDLSDRWTYKWYIAAVKGGERYYSAPGQFSIYQPQVEQVDDGVSLIGGCRDLNKNGSIEPYENWRLPIDQRINDLMSRMTIEEKAYQMFYNAQAFPLSGWAFGPGTIDDMFNKQKLSALTRLGIPFVSAGDCIHGYKTTHPTQSALAASRNLDMVRKLGDMQRREQWAVGFRGTLSPLAEVGTKVLYPRIQEGCGEDAEFSAAMVRAYVTGLQNGPELNPGSVLVTTKHWPGEGAGGEAGIVYDAVTIKYHLKPWFANVDAGAGSVMPGYAGSSFLDPGGPGAGDSKPILDYLREVVKFDGAICTDWLPWGAWVDAANAGADIMGGADPGAEGFSMQDFISQVPAERIDDAVRRILTIKFKLGVFEDPYGDPVNGPDTWFTPENQDLVIDAARQSMTLLKNNGILPLQVQNGDNLAVAGEGAVNGDYYSIWTSYFHDEYGAKTMYESLVERAAQNGTTVSQDNGASSKAAIVVIGEASYTHGTYWPTEQNYIPEEQLTLLRNYKNQGIPVVAVVIMPRPYVLTEVMNLADAVLIAYRPGDGGGSALAQILFGDFAPMGKLPWQLPRSMDQVGTDNVNDQKEHWDLPFDLGATTAERQEIRSKIINAPYNESIPPVYGDPLFQYGDGIEGYTP